MIYLPIPFAFVLPALGNQSYDCPSRSIVWSWNIWGIWSLLEHNKDNRTQTKFLEYTLWYKNILTLKRVLNEHLTWWRRQMETFSALLALCAGNSPVPVNSPHKGQWRGALMLSLICAWIHNWVNNREAGDLRRHRGHYDVTLMILSHLR